MTQVYNLIESPSLYRPENSCGLKTKLARLRGEVQALEGDLQDIERRVNEMEGIISPLTEKNESIGQEFSFFAEIPISCENRIPSPRIKSAKGKAAEMLQDEPNRHVSPEQITHSQQFEKKFHARQNRSITDFLSVARSRISQQKKQKFPLVKIVSNLYSDEELEALVGTCWLFHLGEIKLIFGKNQWRVILHNN